MRCTISSQAIRLLEQAWMARHGVPASLLMEHAAQGIVQRIKCMIHQGKVLFLCGTGNNGGDGYAAARIWKALGGACLVLSFGAPSTQDAAMNRHLCELAGIEIRPFEDGQPLPACGMIVDAMLGIGLDRPVQGLYADAIEQINNAGRPVLAVDIPSGISADTGGVMGCAIRATETVTFHRMKTGMVLGDAPMYCGEITVHPILIPKDEGGEDGFLYAKPDDLRLIPPRPMNGHKGTFGKAVIVAGSFGMAGAAAAAANACIRTGAGLTYIACWEPIVPILQVLAPGAICIPLHVEGDRLTPDSQQVLERAIAAADCCAAGCGMGFHPAAAQLLKMVEGAICPVVWDADALTWISQGAAKPCSKDILTPHPGEAARLLHCGPAEVTGDTVDALSKLWQQFSCGILLKGHHTLMTDGAKRAVNLFGTPAMAKGGSGDVLTGILAGLLCRRASGWNVDTLTTMQLAAMIHGMAGERAAHQVGENSVTMAQLIDAIDMRCPDV